ncbi:hypothetical protein [Bordetella trematum]|nr:hypothetical protein [Bordetella trematum]NNH18613.1 hypothetical protein [Bordetella trematum]
MNQTQGGSDKGSGSAAAIQEAFQTLPAGSVESRFCKYFSSACQRKI